MQSKKEWPSGYNYVDQNWPFLWSFNTTNRLKLDLEKAHGYMDWEFLDFVMARKGFVSKWRKCIQGCLESSHFSIMLNGSPKGFFSTTCGLSQGDPLSPFLFTLVADALSQILRQGEKQHLFKALQLEKEGIPISHLQYVDDMLLFLDGDR